ncbi:MAG: hypothetical protein ABI193_22850 [Minicystis sp.]
MRSFLLIPLSLGVCLGLLACGGGSSPTTTGSTGTTTATTGSGGGSTTVGTGGNGTTTGTGGGPPIDPAVDAACAAFATARCQKLDDCTNDTGVNIRFGNATICAARYKISCVKGLQAGGTGTTVAATNACAGALAGESCDDFFDGPPAAECAVAMGTRAAGAGCITNAQCASTFCAQPPDVSCGFCAPTPGVGDSCSATGDCGNLVCGKSSNLCESYGTAGVSCDKDHPCHSSFTCVGSGGGVKGTCQLSPTHVGDACEDASTLAPDCNHDLGLRCDNVTSHCVVYTYAAAGGSCGKINNGKTLCTGGAECEIPKGMSAGICSAPAADGAACDTKAGPPCLRPAKCVTGGSGSAGICTIQDAASCP